MAENDQWTAVDRYLADLFVRPDPALEHSLKRSLEADLPDIQVSESQGKFLTVLAKALGARRILELGTLGGYSTICLARALTPEGVLVSLEIDPARAALARDNLEKAGLADLVQIVDGRAQDTLAWMIEKGAHPFDLIFIDADKPGYPLYLDLVLQLSHEGTLIVADNVVRKGAVVEQDFTDSNVTGAREFLERLAADPRLQATVIQTVGSKGYDGFAFAVVVDPDM